MNYVDNEFALSRLTQKIHPSAYREWMKIRLRDPKANIEKFAAFLMDRVRLLPPTPDVTSTDTFSDQKNRPSRSHGRLLTHRETTVTTEIQCLKCKKAHDTVRCYLLTRAPLADRIEFVTQNRICKSCMNSTEHRWRDCPTKARCNTNGCSQSHHPLLHDDETSTVNAHQSRRTQAGVGRLAILDIDQSSTM